MSAAIVDWWYSLSWTGIGAALGATLGVINSIWTLLKAYRARPKLRVEVFWESSDQDGSFPEITATNLGGRSIYITTIELVEKDGSRHLLTNFQNEEIKRDQNFTYRAVWESGVNDDRAEITSHDPEFRSKWEGLRVVITDARGTRWKSKPPVTKPRWFRVHEPIE